MGKVCAVHVEGMLYRYIIFIKGDEGCVGQ
jgi:hypothetical protein